MLYLFILYKISDILQEKEIALYLLLMRTKYGSRLWEAFDILELLVLLILRVHANKVAYLTRIGFPIHPIFCILSMMPHYDGTSVNPDNFWLLRMKISDNDELSGRLLCIILFDIPLYLLSCFL